MLGKENQLSHPTVLDHRTNPPTLHGERGDRVLIFDGKAFVVKAVVPLDSAIITPADRPWNSGIMHLLQPRGKEGFLKSVIHKLKSCIERV